MTAYSPFQPRRPSAWPLVVAGAAFALAAFLVLDRTGWLAPAAKAEPRAVTPRGDLTQLEQTFTEVFDRCSPSVASINTSQLRNTFYGLQEARGAGSGFVWDDAGTVVTNNHVVEGATHVTVTVNGKNYRAEVAGTSPQHDLAVLRLRGRVAGLRPVPLGRSADLKVGQTAIAIGNPFGFDQTMTTGVVSALNRTIQANGGALLHGLIQVDAAINRGNSGGPLLDSAGRLIGVTTAIYSPSGTSAGIGFAVPVDTVNEIVPRLLGGRSTVAVLGVLGFPEVTAIDLDPELGYTSGAIFSQAPSEYGAAIAGLKPFKLSPRGRSQGVDVYGDVIVAVDGHPVRRFDDLGRAIASRRPGDTVKVTAIRGLPDEPQVVELPVKLSAQGEGLPSGM